MPKLVLRFVLAATLVSIAVLPAGPAASAPLGVPNTAPPEPSPLLQALTAEAGGDLRVTYHRGTGQVNFIGGGLTSTNPIHRAAAAAASLSAADSAREFLSVYGSLFGLAAPSKELVVQRDRTLADGRSYVRFQQQHQGIPVLGGELIVSLDAARNVLAAGGEVLPDLSLAAEPAVEAAAARQIAIDATARYHGLDSASLQATEPALWIYNPALLRSEKRGASRLVWRMDVAPTELSDVRELVLVDAASGRIALHFNQIDTALNRLTYDGGNTTTLPGTLVCNQAQSNCGEAHATAAHLHAAQTYNYYMNVHGRDSVDGAGLTLVSTVHHSVNYLNAFWNGDQAVYGDAAAFPLADDVVAHELTHAVTQYESNLFYYYQSGSINESLSDVWGELIDLTNGTGDDTPGQRWYMGEDATGLGALRNMANPPEFNDPDRMGSPDFYLGDGDYPANDNGGVHINSGVNNKAVSLLVDGGTFNSLTVSPLGPTKTAQIYYEVQTNLLWTASDYLDLYNALGQACTNLLGSVTNAADCQEVQDAANAVEMSEEPTAGYNTDATLCPAGGSPNTLFYDDLEVGSPAWTGGALVGSNRWGYFTGYATSGTRSFLANDLPAVASDSFIALNPSVANLPAGAYLHFAQSYGFEADPPDYYDGGVLEYSTNGGSSWTDAGGLVQVNGYDGTLANGFGNPLAGRSAFAGDSHGFVSTRLSLASLAGQAVRFRWRMGTDSIGADWGWWIDDVRLYTCGTTSTTSSVYLPFLGRSQPSWTNIATEGFEGAFPTGLWQVSDPGYEEYFWAGRNCRAHTGSRSAWAIGGGSIGSGLGCGANYDIYMNSWMVYGPFSLVGATDAELNFQLWLNSEQGFDGQCAMASVNGNNFFGDCISGNTGGNWSSESLDLTAVYTLGDLRGQPNVWIAFVFSSDESVNYPEGAYVDQVVLRMCTAGTCAAASSSGSASGDLVHVPATRVLDAALSGARD